MSNVLGQGGFGITYYGGDMNLHRYVAIKEFFIQGECVRRASQVALQSGGDTAGFVAAKARFLREARTLARFDHPGIVRVYSVFEENNTVYMVMELLKGKTLMQLLETRGALPESEAVAFIVKVGAALEKVHQSSLLHRDINPSNILVCDDGRVVLIDFGLTKEIEKDTTYSTRKLSGTAILGTASYAPIEQYSRSAQFGPATDLYALGATLYHLLAGEAPAAATARAAGDELLPLQQVKPGVSSGVSRAVAWAMAMDAAKRPQSVRAFLDSLTGTGGPPVTVAATPQVPATIPTSPSATQPAGNAILPLPRPEAYSVKVSARILEWPFACACCGGTPDAASTATFGKSGKRVIRQSSDSLEVPYCTACLKHQELLEAARKQLSAINQVRPASVPIPDPVPLAPLIPTPLPSASTGTVVLTPSQFQPSNPATLSASSNSSGGDEDTGSDWIDTVFACLCVGIFAGSFVGFWLGWFGKTSGFDVFKGTFVAFTMIAMLYGLRRKNREPLHSTSSGGNPPALPGSQPISPTSVTPSITVAFDPRANKQVLDENASKISNLLKGGFFILPIVFRLTGLAATLINAVIATAVIYLFIVPAVWLIFKLYYSEYDEHLENWNRTSKARQQAQDAAFDAALQQAKEEQARLQAAQDAAYLAAKQKAQDEAQMQISTLRAQAEASVSQAQALLQPSCCDIHAAAFYESSYGSVHTFTFKNRQYAEAFAELNEKKLID